jgi:hypothetical protein
MNLRLPIFLLLSLVALAGFSQSVKFVSILNDFGTIREEAGSARTQFEFKNISKDTILISEVKPSCGCITPQFTKDPIPPGKKGSISAEFNPEGRPGEFLKSITVSIKKWPEDALANAEVQILEIKGMVTPRPKELAEAFPVKMGKIRMTGTYISFDSLFTNAYKKVRVTLFNESAEAVTLKRNEAPAYISISPQEGLIKPNDSLTLTLTIDGAAAEDWGNVYYPLRLFTDEATDSEKMFSLFGYRGDFVAGMSKEQKDKMGRGKFETREANFGNIVQGTNVEHEFRLTNTGAGELTIRKWKPGCGCTSSQPDKMKLLPGETATAKAIFNSTGQNGTIHKSITVVTDDPYEPVVILFLQGVVNPADTNQPQEPKK